VVRFLTALGALTALLLLAGTAVASDAPDPAAKGQPRASKLVGQYKGHNKRGRSISFAVSGSKPTVENLSVDVDVECWNDYDNDGNSDTLIAHITGFRGHLKKNGSFDIYYAPDDDTEFEFTGKIDDGKAKVTALVGGTFNADGTPSPTGAYQCDSWGVSYRAKQQ
jgi:hypothetical protein